MQVVLVFGLCGPDFRGTFPLFSSRVHVHCNSRFRLCSLLWQSLERNKGFWGEGGCTRVISWFWAQGSLLVGLEEPFGGAED